MTDHLKEKIIKYLNPPRIWILTISAPNPQEYKEEFYFYSKDRAIKYCLDELKKYHLNPHWLYSGSKRTSTDQLFRQTSDLGII